MTNVTLVCSEPLRKTMAGIGIRYTELAAALSTFGFSVRLYAPAIDKQEYATPKGVQTLLFEPGCEQGLFEQANVVIAQGHLCESLLDTRSDTPCVIDLYDPYLIENISYSDVLGGEIFERDFRNWHKLLREGDFFLCASEQQRLFYIGFLTAAGRINPSSLKEDHDLRRLIDTVPFGVPKELPPYRPYLDTVRDNKYRILFGGLYDWYDPITLLEALDTTELKSCQLIFVRNPNPESTPQQLMTTVEKWCNKRNWGSDRVQFINWVPFERRFDLLQDVDVMVATHADTLETKLSLRTRFIEAIATGCPVITSAGGGLTDIMEQFNAGHVTPPGDSLTLRNTIKQILSEPESNKISETNRKHFLRAHSWQTLIDPLVRFCSKPKLAPKPLNETASNKPANLNKRVSVLMPTYNRMDVLPEVLDSLENQWNAPEFELILVDDGSDDGTWEWLQQREFKIPVVLLHQENKGPATARNFAIKNAAGDYLVLLGDDTVPDRYWLKSHMEAHKARNYDPNVLVVGQIDWHDSMPRTPFLRFIDQTGWQFAFDKIENTESLGFNYFYGSNISIPRRHLDREKFNTEFPYPAWEDTELGYRLQLNGCRFVFEHSARTAHPAYHYYWSLRSSPKESRILRNGFQRTTPRT